jgi:hypothetical protein
MQVIQMPKTKLRGLRPLLAVAAAATLGCGGDLALPDPSGAGLDISTVGGNGQTGPVGEILPDPIVVKVVTEAGQPVSGRRVAFVSSEEAGSLDPDTTETNERGEAVAHWLLGRVPGDQHAEARLVTELEQPPATQLQASAIPAAPDTLRALSPLNQPGRRGDTLRDPLVVLAVDRFGNPVEGVSVAWEVTVGEGELSAATTSTAADGTASVVWKLGGRIGLQRVTATVEGATGSPVTFSATVLF